MAQGAAWFAAVAALLGIAVVALPLAPEADQLGLAATALACGILAAVALVGGGRLPTWYFASGAVVGTLVAGAATHYWGEGSFVGALPFLFPVLYAAWFLPRTVTLAVLVLAAALLAAELIDQDRGDAAVGAWVATTGTLAGAGVLVALLRRRITEAVASLTEAARRDPLTGLLNRRGFEEVFDVELERARRTEQSLSVVVGDLDRFKRINDEHGHAAGDNALRRVGRVLGEGKRSWDIAARVGGEEFAILTPDTDEHGAYILAERLRTMIAGEFAGDQPDPLTISFGIVSYPVHGQTGSSLLQAGDQALYAAKRLGRNRSVISSAEVPGILSGTGGARNHEDTSVELTSLLSLAEALDVRDNGSPTHCRRVGRYSELIARELGLPPDSVERVRIAGVLHDVGRVGVPDELLAKEGPLDEEEWHWVREHPEIGARMLETTDFADIGSWIRSHHERPDGSGYPEGRSGELPLEAAILGVADAYEAMTAPRPYRDALDPQAASDELRRGSGRQFDERVVDALLRVV
ncbi:MAG TPA: diguanylate cyclase [Thermoleophilaceae bacterium]|nr:diguanylate cyclase [Thermoleophilaceae bacterium]